MLFSFWPFILVLVILPGPLGTVFKFILINLLEASDKKPE